MTGKPQFEEGAVIDAAVGAFWRHGYAATSISELTEATKLSRSSLYQRFGDKDGLYREALQSYSERVLRRMNAAKADTPRARLDALLRAFLPDPARPAGCLIGRSCSEIGELTAEGQAVVLDSVQRQRDVFMDILREGIAKAELPQDADVEALAWHYLGVLQAILSFPQLGAPTDVLSHMIDLAMSAWPDASQGA